MKNLYHKIKQFFITKPASRSAQDELFEFLNDKKNVEKAVEGSMQKRLDLMERVKLREKNA